MPAKPLEAVVRQPMLPLKGAVIIDLHGEINEKGESALNTAYDQAEAQQPETIMLNFHDVDYINSTGIALIVGLLARARKARRTLSVYGLSEHYMEIFNITRLVDFMNVFTDEASAISQTLASNGQE